MKSKKPDAKRKPRQQEIPNCTFITSYERDDETDLDFAQARYYNKNHDRFNSPDEPFLDQSEEIPQSWNLYLYVRNNPLNMVDPFGTKADCPPDSPKGCYERDGKYYHKDEDGNEIEYDPTPIKIETLVPRTAVIGHIIRGVVAFVKFLFRRGPKPSPKPAPKSAPKLPPLKLTPGTKVNVNPAQLNAGNRQALEQGRLKSVQDHYNSGRNSSDVSQGPVQVTRDGVIVNGHHRAYEAARRGKSIEVEVVPDVLPSGPPITDLPIIQR